MKKIISAFPGTGKSHFTSNAAQLANAIDLDSKDYTFGYDKNGKAHNYDFPANYILAIKKHIGKDKLLLISCQPDVLTALQSENIKFTLVYPERGLKDQYIQRFKQRNDPQSFIDLISSQWNIFLDFLETQRNCEHIVLSSQQHLSDVIDVTLYKKSVS